jgi:hypothetical protein
MFGAAFGRKAQRAECVVGGNELKNATHCGIVVVCWGGK